MSQDLLAAASDNLPTFTVSELSAALKRAVEDGFAYVRVRGELTGFKKHSSGHMYFGLKDEGAVLDGVCWRGSQRNIRFRPEDGLEVVCTGRLTTYPGRSKYQIVVETMAPAGAGALMALLEERKRALAAEGLFAPERKRALPFLPETIGVVTSPTGAVIRDILHRLDDRFPRHVLLWPVRVQGETAAQEVAQAIRGFNALPAGGPVPRPDVLIVARGGGSIEDLWGFNEEVVVRAAAESVIPLISAVGHETDTTLIDFAADRRAPTPTAAAEMAVPVRSEIALQLRQSEGRLAACFERWLHQHRQHVTGLGRALPRPDSLIGQAAQRLDDRAERLTLAMRGLTRERGAQVAQMGARLRSPADLIGDAGRRLGTASGQLAFVLRGLMRERVAQFQRFSDRLLPLPLTERLGQQRLALAVLDDRLEHGAGRRAEAAAERLAGLSKLLESYSYHGVLERGFALVRDGDQRPVRTAEAAAMADRLELEFRDGRLAVQAASAAGSAPAKPRKRATPPKEQRRLL
ncbi:exodeoxyribonuclease VII large subunit [Marinivivus vitaminiproducens]|uniref:exodeoxyribonuclease VII large subunit n=1 Tax=Marinivivus vitaminiproducens TaxID=3035935 RepID=UPI0027AA3BA3|nr:exodeoxyribonuclease VII large subunit [Geminicoccaceae bacterium SCSIO 64248]